MRRRTHLRTRVLSMTAAFALVLFAITFGLSWRARASQQRWSRLIGVETEAIASLEELIRAQNGVRTHGGDYRIVEQLLRNDTDNGLLRARVKAFATLVREPSPRAEDLDATSVAVVQEAQRLIDQHKREIARTLPELGRSIAGISLSSVDLPAPERPVMNKSSPGSTVKVTFLSASSPPG